MSADCAGGRGARARLAAAGVVVGLLPKWCCRGAVSSRRRAIALWVTAALFLLAAGGLFKIAWDLFYLELEPDERSVFTSFGKGRLGNQISTFATLYALSREYGVSPALSENQVNILSYYFDLDLEAAGFRVFGRDGGGLAWSARYRWEEPFRVPNLKKWFIHNFAALRSDSSSFARGRTISVGPYPNEVPAFYPHLASLRRHLRFRQVHTTAAKQAVSDAKKKYLSANNLPEETEVTLVGVHLRMGDYAKHLMHLYTKSPLNASYLSEAMEHYRIAERLPHPVFLFVSNDVSATERLVLNGSSGSGSVCRALRNCFFLGPEKVETDTWSLSTRLHPSVGRDLAVLSLCSHFVLSYGTFGMWGALLSSSPPTSRTRVIVPRTFADTKEGREIAAAAMPGWIAL